MGVWSTAAGMAEKTPADRNRYVDFLRAVSIIVVIIGHWLMATAWFVDGELVPGHLLKSHPQVQWLTWLFQVMPIFFIVGGYSNAVSLESAAGRGIGYGGWLAARLHRLVSPLLVLMITWAVIAGVMITMDVRPVVIQFTSKAALVPTWFLAIYIMLVVLAPLSYRLWRRFGFASFWAFVGLAAIVDIAFFRFDVSWLGWTNYFWVWLGVHHLGFAWRDGRLGAPGRLLLYAAAGFAALFVMVRFGPYPLAMVGSPDEGLSNTLPPKATLLALGIFQFGVLLSLEAPMRRALSRLRLWTATVLINSMIMTVYLWHITVMVIIGSLMYLSGVYGFGLEPGTGAWWATRPVWIAVLLCLLVPLALLLSPLERRARPKGAAVPGTARQVVGAVLVCLGITVLALFGFGGGPAEHLDIAAMVAFLAGAALSDLLPIARKAPG